MSSYLPAPYESAPDDDLPAAACAALTGTLAVLVAITLARQAWDQYPAAVDALNGGSLVGDDLALVVTAGGWAASAVLMGLGAVLMLVRRGREVVVLGALIGLATTIVARYAFDWFSPAHPVTHGAVFVGGAVVIVLALLPATSRWISGRGAGRRNRGLPPVTSATPLTPTRVQLGQAR